ncbi:MAG: hypothetical protein JWQ63_2218 [Mucilaginibacter sp.]|jgi:hypothetical protein|nr:hypothetical protein [Mucilaginibacter sp.]
MEKIYSTNYDFKPGDEVVLKSTKTTVYKLLYIIGGYAKCRSYSGAERHLRLTDLEKYNLK